MRTGPTINAAGLALGGSFLALNLIPLQDFFQSDAVALGVLLDAFVSVRYSSQPSCSSRSRRFLAGEGTPLNARKTR